MPTKVEVAHAEALRSIMEEVDSLEKLRTRAALEVPRKWYRVGLVGMLVGIVILLLDVAINA